MYRNISDTSEVESIAWFVVGMCIERKNIDDWENYIFCAIRNRVNSFYRQKQIEREMIYKLWREKCRDG